MAWIESHQELARHPKTKRFARLMNENMPTAIGRLHMLWWWALDYAPDGNLSNYDAADIADAVHWHDDPAFLMDCLTSARWIDKDTQTLHDWEDYAGRLLDKRRANVERAKHMRSVRVTDAQQTQNKRTGYGATVPYPTLHNTTVTTDENFAIFWAAFPNKKNKGQAEKTWRKIKPDDELLTLILTGIEKAKQSRQWQKDNGQYIPHPSTWLNAKGWLDEPEQAEPAKQQSEVIRREDVIDSIDQVTDELIKLWQDPEGIWHRVVYDEGKRQYVRFSIPLN